LPRDRQRIQFDRSTDRENADYAEDEKSCGHGNPALAPHSGVRFLVPRRRWQPSRVAQVLLCQPELHDTEQHAYAGGRESVMPAETGALRERAADQRAQERTDVDPHVEDGEVAITPSVSRFVQFT